METGRLAIKVNSSNLPRLVWTSPNGCLRAGYAARLIGARGMQERESGVEKQSAALPDDVRPPMSEDRIIQFGIFCCAVTMVIVLAVGLAAS